MGESERRKSNLAAVSTTFPRRPDGVKDRETPMWAAWLLTYAITLCVAASVSASPTSPQPPSLDQELAQDYQNALVRQGVRVSSLIIVDSRAQGGARRAEIIYRTSTNGTLAAIRLEIVRLLGPSANPRLALDQAFFFPTKTGTTAIGRVIVVVPDYERWLRNEISDEEFYGRWTVRGLR